NFHRDDAPRIRAAEITGGYTLTRVAAAGQDLEQLQPLRGTGWATSQTNLFINPPSPLPPGDSIVLELDWSFQIPAVGAGGRMGWNDDNFFFLAYWYPQMAVYDDVVGWHTDPFLGMAEFYAGFAEYDVTLDVPQGWLVQGTGELMNERDVLPDRIIQRLRLAETSDTVVHVIADDDLTAGFTRDGQDGRLRWHFTADSVRDVAYAITRASLWDAARTEVGDRNGDGRPEYARAEAIFRPAHERWRQTARYAQHSITFHSRHTGFPYPYSHATAVEGAGIIGGGMEFPMMTIIGGLDQGTDIGMYAVTSHELAHNWFPMIVSTDERRRAWMDEGTTDYNDNLATADFFPDYDGEPGEIAGYVGLARTGHEGALMRYSDRLDTPGHYGVHGYTKPGSLLIALRHLLGEEAFYRAYRGYIRTWAFKQPKPWDFFNYFNSSTGQDLDWFWQTWYYETWTLDQSIESVTAGRRGTEIVVRDIGDAPMPARLTITLVNGDTLHREIPVETWLAGARTAAVTVPAGQDVTRVVIDAEGGFPDVMSKNNLWDIETDALPSSWPAAVRNDFVRRRTQLLEEGYVAEDTLMSGATNSRSSESHAVKLEGGVEYAILAVCDQECIDIDLDIVSPADSTLARDVSPNDWPLIQFTAPETGEYDLTLTMYACRARSCTWGGQIYRR
ncbi:MAG TPA: M1 family metallopeptidase, partial [Gemmatimonadota bacterium]|nr:M1 family metallopeptidase [Gemmatimonadota bacterium]